MGTKEKDNEYVVMTRGAREMFLFLVDRNKIKNRWWSYDCFDAFRFIDYNAAINQSRKLLFNSPEVVSFEEAIKLTRLNYINYDYDSLEHPFSSVALGQE